MKKILILLLTACMLLSFTGCSVEKTKTSDYQFMYDGMVKEWNKQAAKDARREDIFGFGAYLYNSYLLLFPRETPSTLEEYAFYWIPGIDVDDYAIYFTCALTDDKYAEFVEGLEGFAITTGEQTAKPLYDTTHFHHPAYILQWRDVGKKWEVLEFILLDEDEHTVVFVYTMHELAWIEEHSDYTVTPSSMYLTKEDFSVYDGFKEDSSTYDLSFLDALR